MSASEEDTAMRWRAVGAEIREAREARGLGQSELAQRTGIAQSQISKDERGGGKFVPFHRLATYAEVLGMDLDVLALMATGRRPPGPGSSFVRKQA